MESESDGPVEIEVHDESYELKALEAYLAGKISRQDLEVSLELSRAHTYRLIGAYKRRGPEALKSRKLGKRNRAYPPELRARVLQIVREQYADFGPTFAVEKLEAEHQIQISAETLRIWMKEEGLWIDRRGRRPRVFSPRPPREQRGELIQVDGSYHRWFEKRGKECCLIVFIDDATSDLQLLRFVEHETSYNYMNCLKSYLETFGQPLALFSDRHSIFRSTNPTADGIRTPTQFARACARLSIQIICAKTPQAKGRVERANRTLQDRLVKELRLRNISTMEEGTDFWRSTGSNTIKGSLGLQPILRTRTFQILMSTYIEGEQAQVEASDFALQVIEHRPEWLIDLIHSMAPNTSDSSDEIRDKLQEFLNKLRLRTTSPRIHREGEIDVDPGTGQGASPISGTGSTSNTETRHKPDDLTVVPSGAQMARLSQNLERAPKLIPLDDLDDIEEKQIVGRAARYYPKSGELFINMRYPAVGQMYDQLVREYSHAPDPEVMQVMARGHARNSMIQRAGIAVVFALAKRLNKEWDAEAMGKALEPESLSLAADNYFESMQDARRALGKALKLSRSEQSNDHAELAA